MADSESPTRLSWRAVSTVIGGVLIFLTLGTLYSFGNMSPYVVSYLRERDVAPDATYHNYSFILGLMQFFQGPGMYLGGFLQQKIGTKWTIFIGIVIFCLSLFASYWAVQKSFGFLILTYGILFGLGLGIAYIPPISCVMEWLPYSKGLGGGFLIAGFGAGALVFNYVQTAFINPHNLKPDIRIDDGKTETVYYSQDSILDRVPLSFLLQGVIFLVMELLGLCLIQAPPNNNAHMTSTPTEINSKRDFDEKTQLIKTSSVDSDGQLPYKGNIEGDTTYHSDSAENSTVIPSGLLVDQFSLDGGHTRPRQNSIRPPSSPRGDGDARWSGLTLTLPNVFKQPFFWQISIAMCLDGINIIVINSLYKAYGQTFIEDDLFLATVGALSSVCNAGSRIAWGHLADTFPFKVLFMLVSGTLSVFTFTLPLTPYGGKPMFLIWICMTFVGIGGLYACAPVGVSRAFGSTHFGKNYGMVFLLGTSMSGLIGPFIESALQQVLSWAALFVAIGGFSAIAIVLSMFMNVKARDGKDI